MMSHHSQISLQNIWILFLYAHNLVSITGQYKGEIEQAKDLPDLLARLLVHAVEERLKSNLHRGYYPQKAITTRVRGQIDILKTESQQLLKRGLIATHYQNHTYDTYRNQLVLSALKKVKQKAQNKQTLKKCNYLCSIFHKAGVSERLPSQSEILTDQIARHETIDRLMVSLSQMFLNFNIPTFSSGKHTLSHYDASEHLVRRLFEKAIGNALRIELIPQGWQVTQGRRLKWPCTDMSEHMAKIIPQMIIDIELLHKESNRKIIIDTKFTNIYTRSQFRDQILKSQHLYQIYSYLRTQEIESCAMSQNSEGMLLHPQIGDSVHETTNIQGHKISFRTLDLSAPANQFESNLKKAISI